MGDVVPSVWMCTKERQTLREGNIRERRDC